MQLGDLSLVFIVAFSVLGGLAILFFRRRFRDRRDAGLLRAARALGGRVPESAGFELRSLHFEIEGRQALVEYETGEENLTRIKVAMSRRSPGVLRIARQNTVRLYARVYGLPDLKIGDRDFDRAWYVTARPAPLLQRVFSEERREKVIASVNRLGRFELPSIEITRDTFIVRVNGLRFREDEILDLAQTAIDFVGYILRLGPEEGIAWVADGDVEAGLCPVCASPLSDAVVFCDKCKTPQHEECWVYVGQCSTYACKGKRFVA